METGTKVTIINRDRLGSYGKTGTVTGFDTSIRPGELFALVDIAGSDYCFHVSDLAKANPAI